MKLASAVAGLAVLAVILSACGGGGSATAQTTARTSTSTATTKAGAATTTPTSTVKAGPVHGTLSAENHKPVVGQQWRYTVTATDAAGRPLSGTVDVQFVFGGQVVGRDSPPTHPVKDGRWSDTLVFPARSVGQPLAVQAVVHTSKGSITMDWPITVQR